MRRLFIASLFLKLSIVVYSQSTTDAYFSFLKTQKAIEVGVTYDALRSYVAENSFQLTILTQSKKITGKEVVVKELSRTLEMYKDMISLWSMVIDTKRAAYFSPEAGFTGSEVYVPLFEKYPKAVSSLTELRKGFGPEISLMGFILVINSEVDTILSSLSKIIAF